MSELKMASFPYRPSFGIVTIRGCRVSIVTPVDDVARVEVWAVGWRARMLKSMRRGR